MMLHIQMLKYSCLRSLIQESNGGRVMTAVQRLAPPFRPYLSKNSLGPQEMRAAG